MVSVEAVDVGFGENEAVVPAGTPATLSVTGSLKPFVGVTVTVYDVDPPRTTDCVDGEALSEKSGEGVGGGAVTIRDALVEWLTVFAVPVIAKGYVPAGVAALVATVSVDESAGFGAKPAVVPAGKPLTESVTGSGKPPLLVTVIE